MHLFRISNYIISDNTPYYKSKLVKKYLTNSRIKIKFLPFLLVPTLCVTHRQVKVIVNY